MTTWKVVLTDRSFKPVDEIRGVRGLQYVRSLNKLATCQFQVRLDNRQVNRLSDCDGFIKLYRDSSLRYFGPIISAEQSVDRAQQTLAITSADIGWMLLKRLAGKSATGQQFTVATDLAAISKLLIDTTNTMADTGISTTTVALTSGSSRTFTAGPYRNILEIVAELGSALDGYDWRFVPIENWSNGALTGTKVGYFDAQTLIGTAKPNAVFEYGANTRSNVLSFVKTRTRDGQANRVIHIASDPASVYTGNNATEQTNWGILEDVINISDITDGGLRQNLVDEHVRVRGGPRDLVKLTPHIDPGVTGRMPQPFVDYDIGDTISARIVNAGAIRFAGVLRVYGITINVEETTGFERVELALEDDS